MLKFSKRRSNSKVKDQKVKVMVSNERSCQKEYKNIKALAPTNQKLLPRLKFADGWTDRQIEIYE
jgi:hypothetical protein